MTMSPIFIIGSERSGSNLLRLILNSHSKIAIPHPPHIMRDFVPILRFYGELKVDRNFLRLVHDVVQVVNAHFAPWPFLLKESDVIRIAKPTRSLFGIYCAIYDLYLEYSQKQRWGCKSTFMHQQVEEICKHFENPKFIHLVRDPRAVVASAKKSIFSAYQPQIEAKLWEQEQSSIQKRKQSILNTENTMTIRYEDLVESPQKVVNHMMNFLGEMFEEQQLSFFESHEASSLSKLSESWKNCGEPITQDRIFRYRNELRVDEIEMVESITSSLMSEFGYARETAGVRPPASHTSLILQESYLKLKAEFRSFRKDKNFSQRWKKKFLLKKIRFKRAYFHWPVQGVEEAQSGHKF